MPRKPVMTASVIRGLDCIMALVDAGSGAEDVLGINETAWGPEERRSARDIDRAIKWWGDFMAWRNARRSTK